MPGQIGGGEVLFGVVVAVWTCPGAGGGGYEGGVLLNRYWEGGDAEGIDVSIVLGL